ncbi:hypothetical protein ACFKHW_30365 [Bradyrhizobium lupini]|uniref:hypothetical protein n=1 Tax=Rhizobium lupini TaxID=136996 RepID=UPI00366CC286
MNDPKKEQRTISNTDLKPFIEKVLVRLAKQPDAKLWTIAISDGTSSPATCGQNRGQQSVDTSELVTRSWFGVSSSLARSRPLLD